MTEFERMDRAEATFRLAGAAAGWAAPSRLAATSAVDRSWAGQKIPEAATSMQGVLKLQMHGTV